MRVAFTDRNKVIDQLVEKRSHELHMKTVLELKTGVRVWYYQWHTLLQTYL